MFERKSIFTTASFFKLTMVHYNVCATCINYKYTMGDLFEQGMKACIQTRRDGSSKKSGRVKNKPILMVGVELRKCFLRSIIQLIIDTV